MDGKIGITLQFAATPGRFQNRLKLRGGEVLSIRINEKLGKQRYSVTIRGSVIPIRSNVALRVGDRLQAKVVVSGTRITLKIIEAALPAGDAAATASVRAAPYAPASLSPEVAAVLMRAMRRSGLPLIPEAMSTVIGMVPPDKRKDPSFVRLATVLFDKRLHVDPERLEELYLSISGRGGRHSTSGREGRQEGRSDQDREARHPARVDLGGPQAEPGGETDEDAAVGPSIPSPDGLRKELRKLFSGGLEAASEEPRADLLTVFNHRAGAHGNWMVVPFSMIGTDVTVEGSVRLLLDSSKRSAAGGLKVLRASIVVDGVGGFEISGIPPKRLSIHAESASIREKIDALVPELAEKLRNLGVEIDDTNTGGAIFDGFTAETTEIRGVNATA